MESRAESKRRTMLIRQHRARFLHLSPSSLLVFRAASDAFPVESLRAREPVAALKYLRIYDECLFTRLLPPVALARGNAT